MRKSVRQWPSGHSIESPTGNGLAGHGRLECLDIALMTGEFPVEACVETLPNHHDRLMACWFVIRRGVGYAPFTFLGGSKWI